MGLLSRIRNAIGAKQAPAEIESAYGPPDRILQYRWLAADYLQMVLGQTDALVSDESTLWDFHDEATNDAYYQLTLERYGVNVSDVPDALLIDILEKINRESTSRFWMMEDPSTFPEVRSAGERSSEGE